MLQTSLLLMKILNKTKAHIFYLFCALCFKRQSFLLLFYYNAATVLSTSFRKSFFCLAHYSEEVNLQALDMI